MSDFQAAGTIILFFALRCIAPLVITVAIGYLMNRLVGRWEAEETAAKETVIDAIPVMPAAEKTAATRSLPCWVVRNCDEKKRASCPAHLNQSLPCWIARLLSEGEKPDSCPGCPVYDPRLAIN